MPLPESSVGTDAAFEWKTYDVRRSEKQRLLRFLLAGLEMRGCRILSSSDPRHAPFYIVFETPAGERHAALAYAFRANSRRTNARPADEHRFQIKYGNELRGVLDIAIDRTALVTTIFLGIDLERGIFVAADPIMNAPSPMSRSIEFKAHHVGSILREGWFAWERARKAPKTTTRPTPEIDEDTRIQVLVGGTQDRVYDLIVLERLALGLDPGERHLLADRLASRPDRGRVAAISHPLLDELALPPESLFDLIEGAARLKMAVRGWVAEQHLEERLQALPGVTDCRRLNSERETDIALRWKGSAPILIECKNVMRRPDAYGRPRVDFQRTRASKADPCSRYYARSEFSVLAACLHALTEEWEFSYALTRDLPAHTRCSGKITNNIRVIEELFTDDASAALDRCVQ